MLGSGVGALVLMICTAGAVACQADKVVSPDEDPIDTPPEPVTELISLRIWPADFTLTQGGALQLSYSARDQRAERILGQGTVDYTSGDPEVAQVSDSGVVTGIAPGSTVISATFRLADSSRTATMKILVTDSIPAPSVHLRNNWGTWEPVSPYLAAGGEVTWYSVSDETVVVWDEAGTIWEEIPFSGGSASRRFDVPGTIHYCIGCWAPPRVGGIVHVR